MPAKLSKPALSKLMDARGIVRDKFGLLDRGFAEWIVAHPEESQRPEILFHSELRARVLAAADAGIDALITGRKSGETLDDIFAIRWHFVSRYSYALPTREAINWMAGVGPILEVGAGKGFWAACVAAAGGDIVAFEPDYFSDSHFKTVRAMAGEVEAEHADRILFLCWPPYDNPMAADSLRAYLAAGGERLIYIGEADGWSTGTREFFEQIRGNFDREPCPSIPSWPGTEDSLYYFRRRR